MLLSKIISARVVTETINESGWKIIRLSGGIRASLNVLYFEFQLTKNTKFPRRDSFVAQTRSKAKALREIN